MNLIIDAGNSRIKVALFERSRMVEFIRMAHWDLIKISRMLASAPFLESGILSAVREVPAEIMELVRHRLHPLHILAPDMPLPIGMEYKTPETLGKDRIAAAVGAWDRFRDSNLLVIDAGTALTMDLVSEEGRFLGGNISPGMRMRFKALHEYTRQLPLVEPLDEVPIIGKTTEEAIRAGVIRGMVYEVDNYINSLKNKYNGLRVIITGGDAQRLMKKLKNTIFVDQYLVLNGLNRILLHQQSE